MNNLSTAGHKPLTIGAISEDTRRMIEGSTADSTRRAYRSDARIFAEWCASRDLPAMPATPETIADFLSDQNSQGVNHSTLNRRTAAIKYVHEAAGFESPTASMLVRATMKGIRRAQAKAPKAKADNKRGKKSAATIDILYQMLSRIDTSTMQGIRDRALLLLAFATACRRSELSALDVSDIEFMQDGAKVTIRQSKTDQEGEGQTIAVINGRLNVVGILKDYLAAAGIHSGAVFRPITKGGRFLPQHLSDRAISEIIKRYARAAGLDADKFAGHSTRAGFITTAALNGSNLFKIMEVSRHKNIETVKQYVRDSELFKDHAGVGFL